MRNQKKAQDDTTASFIFKDTTCMHRHAKQYADQSCTEKQVKRKTNEGAVNVVVLTGIVAKEFTSSARKRAL
jgi:hypothetical protein